MCIRASVDTLCRDYMDMCRNEHEKGSKHCECAVMTFLRHLVKLYGTY